MWHDDSEMAGYSGTPLTKKLGIAEGSRVAVLGAPGNFSETLGTLPPGATVATTLRGSQPLDVVIAFVTRRTDYETRLPAARARIAQDGAIWIAWPKQAAKVATDMSENVVRAVALPTGLVDNKVCAIDATWSGLRLVIRLGLRT
jgi:hypothetical protein